MNNIILSEEAFNQLQQNTIHYVRDLLAAESNKPMFRWLTNKEAMKMLDASPRTMQNWRDDGTLGFSQIGHKIYYSQDDLEHMLQRHYKKPFKAIA